MPSFKTLALWAFLTGATFLGIRSVVLFFASDETKIGWLLEDVEQGFNSSRNEACLRPFAADWVHEPLGVDRELLRGALVQLFFQAIDPVTKRFLFVAEVDDETLAIEVDDAGRTAQLTVEVDFATRSQETLTPTWRIAVEAGLENDSEFGWLFVTSRHTQLSGEPLHARR